MKNNSVRKGVIALLKFIIETNQISLLSNILIAFSSCESLP